MYVLIVLGIICFLYFYLNDELYKKWGIVLSLVSIFTIFAFRDYIGVDDKVYMFYYNLIKFGKVDYYFSISATEYSFYLISKIISFLGFNYKVMFSFYSSLSFIFLHQIITKCFNFNKKESFIFLLSFLAFSILPYITIMRQFLAATIGIYACFLFVNREIKKSFLYLLLAIFFHYSAILFVLIPLLYKIKPFSYKITYFILSITAIVLSKTGLFLNFLKFILQNSRYYGYIENFRNLHSSSGIVVMFMFICFLIAILLINFKKNLNNKLKLTLIFQLCFFCLYFLTSNLGVIARVYDYFIIFEFMPLILMYRYIREEKFKLITSRIKFLNLKNIKSYTFNCIIIMLLVLISYNFIYKNFDDYSLLNYSLNFWSIK